jgi:hypothetical protein
MFLQSLGFGHPRAGASESAVLPLAVTAAALHRALASGPGRLPLALAVIPPLGCRRRHSGGGASRNATVVVVALGLAVPVA